MSEKYPERHWQYDDREETMPAYMNEGYAPPDWDLLQSMEASDEETN